MMSWLQNEHVQRTPRWYADDDGEVWSVVGFLCIVVCLFYFEYYYYV